MKGGFECQGYGIKLVWIDPDTQEREQNIRRVIGAPAVYDDDSKFMQVDVNQALDAIENLSLETDELFAGPFSVFAVPRDQGIAGAFPPEPAAFCGSIKDENAPALPINPPEDRAEDDAEEEIETIVSPFINNPSTPSSYDDFFTPTSSAIMELSQGSDSVDIPLPPLTTRHLDLLPRPAEQRALIHHWTNFVAWHLVPVDRPDNLFRSVFTPMALAGLNSPSNQSNGQIALFHALCATSAFSRGQLLNGDMKTQMLAMKHYHLAVMHLRHSLANIKENMSLDTQRGPILATITMFSAMDMITGRSSEWRTHLQGGASWLATIEGNVWDRDKSSSMVYQGYLAIAALCNINLPSTVDVEADDFLDRKNYVLDRFFGLTRPILKHIVLMNSLIKRTAESPSQEVLDELEIQLYTETPEGLDLEGLDPMSQSLTRHHAYVFYYASLIYFQRTVRRRPPEFVQEIVQCAVKHLEEIEALGGDTIGCTLVWPPFVVASECLTTDLQERMLAWYMLKRRHGFMNLEISKDIAKELWRRRQHAEPGEDIHWQDVLKDLKMDIVLA